MWLLLSLFIGGYVYNYYHRKKKLAINGEIAYTIITEVNYNPTPPTYTYRVIYRSGAEITVSASRWTFDGRMLMDLAVNKDQLKHR